MLLTSLSHYITAVTLGNHYETGTICLELVYVWIHTVGCGRTHRTTRIALWGLGWTGIEHRIFLEVIGQTLAGIQTSLQLGMCNIASHNDGTLQVDAGTNRILREFLTNSIDTLVQVDLYTLATLAGLTQLFRNQFCGIRIHLLQPDTVGIDLRLDISVGRTRDAHTNRTRSTMTWQTDHTDIVSQVLTTELRTETNLLSLLNQFLLQVNITESTPRLITGCGQTIIELNRSEFHGQQVLLSRSATNHKGNMVWRTSGSTQTLHLLYQERNQGALVLDGRLGHGVEIGLVGRTTTLSHHHKVILSTLGSLDVNLGREITTGVHLVVHVQRGILRIAQVVLCKGVEHTQTQGFLILEARPDLLSLLTMDNGCTCILTERQNTLGSSLGITQELQGHVLIIL